MNVISDFDVVKFGWTSVETAEKIKNAARLVCKQCLRDLTGD